MKKEDKLILDTQSLVHKACKDIMIIIQDVLAKVDNKDTHWLVAARIVNGVWAEVYRPTIKVVLEDITDKLEQQK